MGARRNIVGREAEADAGEQRAIGHVERGQHVRIEPVLLEAEAAAPARDQLVEGCLAVDANRRAEEQLEIGKADRLAMRGLHAGEAFRRRLGRRVEPQVAQIGGEAVRAGHGAALSHDPRRGSTGAVVDLCNTLRRLITNALIAPAWIAAASYSGSPGPTL